MKALRCCFKPGFNHGKTSRTEGVAGTWPTGQLVVGGALCSQFLLKLALVTACTLPSPSKIVPEPAAFRAECIFNDHETGPAIATATSLPSPLAGEKP
jgi:hypothetical protein